MADILDGGNAAANLWIGLAAFQNTSNQNWRSNTFNGCGSSITWTQGQTPTNTCSVTGSTFLGVDSATGIGYFSFTLSAKGFEVTELGSCCIGLCGGVGPPGSLCKWHQPNGTTSQTFTISGNGVCTPTAPIDGHKIYNYAGYPVVGCAPGYLDGGLNKHWFPIKAATAAANTMASAITALALGAVNFNEVNCNDVAVTITGFA